jgi:hypothetical protein
MFSSHARLKDASVAGASPDCSTTKILHAQDQPVTGRALFSSQRVNQPRRRCTSPLSLSEWPVHTNSSPALSTSAHAQYEAHRRAQLRLLLLCNWDAKRLVHFFFTPPACGRHHLQIGRVAHGRRCVLVRHRVLLQVGSYVRQEHSQMVRSIPIRDHHAQDLLLPVTLRTRALHIHRECAARPRRCRLATAVAAPCTTPRPSPAGSSPTTPDKPGCRDPLWRRLTDWWPSRVFC